MVGVEGEALGRYRLLEVLRSGSTGTVYRAHDTMMSREVAVKVLSPELAADPAHRERFQREVSIAARLNDPNIMPVYEAGEIDGRPYLVMPAVADGITVQDLLRRDGPLHPVGAARVVVQVASALEAAHVAGLVHGDVKAASLVVGGAFVYLTDFGAAPTGGDTADARTDIYALTAVLYECLTGQPATAGTAGDLAPPKPTPKPTDVDPAIPAGFDEVIERGMAEDPDDRYQTARELSIAAHDALTAPTAPAASGPAPPKEVEFGRYRLFEKLGQGSMGAVYRAHDTMLDRDVAVKLLQPEMAAEPGFRERFRREAYAAARLANPNIIPIYETGEIDGRLYLVMPIVDGVDLNKVLKRDGAMSPAKAVRVVEQVAGALDAAHKSGLVHRDVKPSNLLMVGDDFVYLIDFGLVHEASAGRLTLTNVAPGSPAYMAPERFSAGKDGRVVDARADVYSLACVLYECLTGRLPFSGGGVEGLAAAHRTDAPPKPSSIDPAIPAGFDHVIARGMAKEPDDRYQSAHELAVAARAALTGVVNDSAPPTRASDAALCGADTVPTAQSPPRTPHRLGRRFLISAAVVVAVVIAAAAFLRVANQFPFQSAKPPGQVVLPFTDLDNPEEVAVDAKGDVYVTDSGHNRVLKLAAGSTSQTVVPLPGLDHPDDIAVDDAGDLVITEPELHRVLELTAGSTTPIVLPFADLRDPTGVVVASRGPGNDRAVVVSDCAHNRVVKLLGQSTEQAVLPLSGLACPSAVTVSRGGALFVVDRDNERVLKLPWTATVPTVLPFVVGHPDDVAVDTGGNVYVTEGKDNRVTKFVRASNTSITLPFNGVKNPQGIGIDAAGNVYVVDTGNKRVLKLPPG